MFFPLLVFVVALVIATIAAWFSVAGLMAIFAASAIPVAIMAGSLEVGKLIAASWVYRNWKRSPFLLKSYLTFATIVLMFITSMGIFGFLSSAYLEQASEGKQSQARVERIENDIIRYEDTIARTEVKIAKLETETANDTGDIQSQIDTEQQRMDQAYARVQPAINEQNEIISNEQRGSEDQVQSYLTQIAKLDETLDKISAYVENDDIRKLQALVGTRVDGNYGTNTANKVREFAEAKEADKARLVSIVEDIRTSVDTTVVDMAREEIKRLRAIADRDVQQSTATIERLRSQLNAVAEVDNTDEIDTLIEKVRTAEMGIETAITEKFELESAVRKLEAEVGPIKYIADLVYGQTDESSIDSAVRWLIIVFIFVFDPLAVLLLIAANFSFQNRHDHDGRQEEIFDALFAKKDNKPLDKSVKKDDNVSIAKNEIKETSVKESSIEDLEREINTRKELNNPGWLDN